MRGVCRCHVPPRPHCPGRLRDHSEDGESPVSSQGLEWQHPQAGSSAEHPSLVQGLTQFKCNLPKEMCTNSAPVHRVPSHPWHGHHEPGTLQGSTSQNISWTPGRAANPRQELSCIPIATTPAAPSALDQHTGDQY